MLCTSGCLYGPRLTSQAHSWAEVDAKFAHGVFKVHVACSIIVRNSLMCCNFVLGFHTVLEYLHMLLVYLLKNLFQVVCLSRITAAHIFHR